jgi:hypothetical protein
MEKQAPVATIEDELTQPAKPGFIDTGTVSMR